MTNQLCEYGCGQVANHRLKNGKYCCSKHYTQCQAVRSKNAKARKNSPQSGWRWINRQKKKCQYCDKEVGSAALKRHENSCYLNPVNKIDCPVCGKPIKNYRCGTTCSHACANTHFRSKEDNPGWRKDSYRSTCFLHHDKKCAICGESNIVAVHHFDENRTNNEPSNLIPLCPTHHQYMHSQFRVLIIDEVKKYIDNFVGE